MNLRLHSHDDDGITESLEIEGISKVQRTDLEKEENASDLIKYLIINILRNIL